MKSLKALKVLIQEFTDNVLIDQTRQTILINFNKRWFKAINTKLQKNNFSLIFKNLLKDTYTCVYKYRLD